MLKWVCWLSLTFLGGILVSGSPYFSEARPNTTQVMHRLLIELRLDYLFLSSGFLQDASREPVVEPLGKDILITKMAESRSPFMKRLHKLNHVRHLLLHSPQVPLARLTILRRYRGNVVAVI